MKGISLFICIAITSFLANAQTLQTVTDNGASTYNTLTSLNPNGFQVTGGVGSPAYFVVDQTANSGGKRWRFGHTGISSGFGGFDIYNITDGIAPLSIMSNGKIGIGTTNPKTLTEIKRTFPSGSQDIDFLRLTSSQAGAWFSQLGLQFRWEDTGNQVAFNLAQITAISNWPNGTLSGGDLQFWTKSLNASTESELTEKMRIDASGNVGIGTTAPNEKLHLLGGINITNPIATNQFMKLYVDGVVGFLDGGQGSLSMVYNGVQHIWRNPADQDLMRIDPAGNIGIGTTSPREKLSVNGKIRAHEIKVETNNWPDYVFAKSYLLSTLQETEKHINENDHLPCIPSAVEVKANGIDLGEMNAKLLQKIEELTLHLIELKKK